MSKVHSTREAEAVQTSLGRVSPAQRIFFWTLLLLVAVGRLIISLADYRSLIAHDILQDDAFYYFKIADNLVAGHGLTFDGQMATTGFQPLWLFLLAPMVYLTRPDLVAPIHVAGILSAAIAVATGWAIFALARAVAGVRPALFALALWAVTPYFIVFGMNGQETGLAMFFGILVVLVYLRLMSNAAVSYGACAGFGFICGMAILARLDLALLLAAVLCDWIRRRCAAQIVR